MILTFDSIFVLTSYHLFSHSLKNPHQLEGAINIFSQISSDLTSDEHVRSSLDGLIAQYLLAHLTDQHGFVVARACNAFRQYVLHIQDENLIREGTKFVFAALKHPELPARVQAAVSLRYVVQAPQSQPLLGRSLPELFQLLFTLMNEVYSDELVSSLEAVIYEFRYSIGPFAVSICDRLTKELFRLSTSCSDDDPSDASVLASSECSRTLVTVLSGVRKTPELYGDLFRVMLPFLKHAIMETVYDDFFENAMKIMAFISYYIPKPFPNALWILFVSVVAREVGEVVDYIEYIGPFLDNMITRDPDTLLCAQYQGELYLQWVWKFLSHILTKTQCEIEGTECLKIVEVILQNCAGKVDPFVPLIFQILLWRLPSAQDPDFRVLIYTVFANLLYYNPWLALQCCEEKNATEEMINQLLTAVEMPQLQRLYDQKQLTLGLSSLLKIPFARLPVFSPKNDPKFVDYEHHLVEQNEHKDSKEIKGKGDSSCRRKHPPFE